MSKKKTWAEKLCEKKEPKVKRIDFDFADIPAGSAMFIATPLIIDAYVRQIPKGRKVDVRTMRRDLALEHRADHTCPVTTGIFLRIVAEAAYEGYLRDSSMEEITPFWRIVEPESALAKKLTFGQEFIREQREREGIDNEVALPLYPLGTKS